MTNPYGPWATAIDAGRYPQLSAFWKQRLTMLVPTSQTSPVLSRRNLLGLVAAAFLTCVLPTFHAAPAVAEQEKAADKKSKTDITQPANQAKRAESLSYTGKVVDAVTGKPIEGAVVIISRTIWTSSEPQWRVLEKTKHRTDAEGAYRFTITSEQVAQPHLYIEVDEISHPRYALYHAGGCPLAAIREGEKLGARPFFEKLRMSPGEEISGTVLTPDGKPAAGVAVKVESSAANQGDGRTGSTPGGVPNNLGFSHAETMTNDQGVFRVNVIKGGSGRFTLHPEQYAPSGYLLERPGDQGRLILRKGTRLQGRVLDALGKPLAGAWVAAALMKSAFAPAKAQPGSGQPSLLRPIDDHVLESLLLRGARSNEKGEFQMAPLPPGLYSVIPYATVKGGLDEEISRRDSLPGLFLNQKVTLREGEPTHSAEIRAIPHVSIEIQWLDSAGKPSAGNSAVCEGKLQQSQESYFDDRWYEGLGNRAQPRSDSSGKMTVLAPKGLRDATLVLDADDAVRYRKAKDAPLINDRTVPLGALDENVQGIIAIRYRSPAVVVKAVAADGALIEDCKPKAVYPRGIDVRTPGDVFFKPLDDGRWRSERLLPDQEFTLTLEAPGYKSNSQKLSLPEGTTKELVVKLKRE
jgi:hypothetical protein